MNCEAKPKQTGAYACEGEYFEIIIWHKGVSFLASLGTGSAISKVLKNNEIATHPSGARNDKLGYDTGSYLLQDVDKISL